MDVAPVGEPPPESILPRRIATLSLGQVAERAGTLDADGAGASSDCTSTKGGAHHNASVIAVGRHQPGGGREGGWAAWSAPTAEAGPHDLCPCGNRGGMVFTSPSLAGSAFSSASEVA